MINKKRAIVYCIIIGLIISYLVGRKVLFIENYTGIEIDTEAVQSVTIFSKHLNKEYTTEDSEDIEKVIEFLQSLKIRERNLYETIMGENFALLITRRFTIRLYSGEAGNDSNLIMEIIVLPTVPTGRIVIDGKGYKLSNDTNSAYNDIYDLYYLIKGEKAK